LVEDLWLDLRGAVHFLVMSLVGQKSSFRITCGGGECGFVFNHIPHLALVSFNPVEDVDKATDFLGELKKMADLTTDN